MSRTRLLTAITFICLFFGWLELYDQPLPEMAGDVLHEIEEKTNLPVTDVVEAVTGSPVAKASKHAGLGKNIQQIMQEELAERQAVPEAQAEGKLMVTLSSINFQGVTILGDLELQQAVAKYLNVPMDYEQMLEIGMTVESYYRQHNYLARVILPPQDLSAGILQLDVIESVVSKIEVEQKLEELPNTQAHVLALIEAQQEKGESLNTKSIERGIALANDVPGVSVQASLKDGEEAGDTELLLKMYQSRTKDADITLDNAGSRSTGATRLMATLNLFNPNDLQDLFNLVGVHTNGSDYVRNAYSIPIGVGGWRMGANFSLMNYKVVVGDIGMVGAFGDAVTKGLEWTYPLIRSDAGSATLTVNADAKHYKNTSAQGVLMSDYETRVLSVQMAGYYRDLDPSGGSGSYSVQFSHGNINLDGSLSQQSDMAKTEGTFDKLRAMLAWEQPLNSQMSSFASYSFQLADKNLDSSERMQLGGLNGVRAFPTGEGSGADAQLLQLELRYKLDSGYTLAGFYDWGQVWQMHDPDFSGSPQNNRLTYQGYGASIGYTTPAGISMKAIWARRREENPNPTQFGKDQDGSYDRNRYWLQLNVPF
jgi:hemolysin activation/secretion protein